MNNNNQKQKTCSNCNGQGFTWVIGNRKCPSCHGTGAKSGMVIDGERFADRCHTCNGQGVIKGDTWKEVCKHCNGKGKT